MISMKASQIASIVSGVLHGDDALVTAPAFLSSRNCLEGSIFLAIKGENVDGHDYVSDAFKNGAVIALTTQQVAQRCIIVDDVTRAISALASHVRNELSNLMVVGITGSQGKTTTKELLAAILSAEGSTVSPKGNNNNELGVPITLLQCTKETQYCIVEMGARHQGDIAALANIASPHVGVVLRVAAAHIGEFGSLETIAKTKSEMISTLSEDGIAILGRYDDFTPQMKSLHKGKTLFFGEDSSADIRATDIEIREGRPHFDLVTPEGRSTVALRLYGEHQVSNALAAAAVAHVLGISTDHIAVALSTAEIHARWRMEVKELHDLTIINDAYNASPDSMAAALRTLVHLTQERGGESWAFLGNMRELGESSRKAHSEIGTLASSLGVDHLVAVGAPDYALAIGENSQISIHNCLDRAQALTFAQNLNRGDVVLCKASRSDGLEVLAENIEMMWNSKIESEEGVSE
ncbi:MurF UDP-N-acetylmuramyl pentapeptide synthase [Candidatus Nanopelagicaceae bacterium]